jgi:hypothetical protein
MNQFLIVTSTHSGFRLGIVILAVALLATAVLRITGVAGKRTITHDEGISYLSATGHQGEYSEVSNGLYPAGNWVHASQLKRFVRLERRFCFKQIGFDLAHYDIHPPLYFWLLHLWSLMFGVNVWTGPSLNVLMAFVATLFLFRLALDTLGDLLEASLVTFTWALSPAVIPVSFEARSYDLLALCTIVFVWQVIKYTDLTKQPGPGGSILLVVSGTAGALTHYHFSLVVLGCIIFSFARLIRRNKRRLITELALIGTGYIIFFLIHPDFFLSLQRHRRLLQPFEAQDIIPRISTVVSTIVGFFVYGALFKYILLSLSTVFIGWLLIAYFTKRWSLDFARINSTGFYILFFFFWIAGATLLLYLTFQSSEQAMGTKYLSAAWPFFAFAPVFLLRLCGKFRRVLAVSFCFVLFLFGIVSVWRSTDVTNKISNPSALLDSSDMIVVDNVRRGILPRILWHVPDNKLVFASDQVDLLDHQDAWLGRLKSKSLFVSVLSYGNTAKQQQQILNLIRHKHNIVPTKGGIWGLGDVFEIR